MEVKLRVGTGGDGSTPDPTHLAQIDGYVHGLGEPSAVGLLTDGKHWIMRTPTDRADRVRETPYRFTLERADQWIGLFEWLRDQVFVNPPLRPPTIDNLQNGFGPGAPISDRHLIVRGAR